MFNPQEFVRKSAVNRADLTLRKELPDPAFVARYLSSESADAFFYRLKTQIIWKDKWWNNLYKLPQQAYHYTISERDKNTCAVLEELIWLVEHIHDAKASEVWCNLFRGGDDHMIFHQDGYEENLTTMSFGCDRQFLMRDLQSGKVAQFDVGHGDMYTWSPETGQRFQHALPIDRAAKGLRISVVVWTAPPGSGR